MLEINNRIKLDYNKLYDEHENLLKINNELNDKNLYTLNEKIKLAKKLEENSMN